MSETDHKYDDPLEEAFREVHDALDSLESYLKQQIGHGGPDQPDPLDLVVRLRQAVIAKSWSPDGS